jgi:hypothetical protein
MEAVMRKIAIAGVLEVASASCMTPSQQGSTGGVLSAIQVQPNRQFELGVGQEAQIQGTPIVVRFTRVSEDSRCPIDVNCVWAGDGVLKFALSGADVIKNETSLHTTLEPKLLYYGGYTIRLIDLKPTPRSGAKIPATAYLATLEASK